jgi:hypothetical protein
MLIINKEYLISYNKEYDQAELPIGLVYQRKDLQALLQCSKATANNLWQLIRLEESFTFKGVKYDSTEIKEEQRKC